MIGKIWLAVSVATILAVILFAHPASPAEAQQPQNWEAAAKMWQANSEKFEALANRFEEIAITAMNNTKKAQFIARACFDQRDALAAKLAAKKH